MALVSTSQNVTDQSSTPLVMVNAQKKGAPTRVAHGYLAADHLVPQQGRL